MFLKLPEIHPLHSILSETKRKNQNAWKNHMFTVRICYGPTCVWQTLIRILLLKNLIDGFWFLLLGRCPNGFFSFNSLTKIRVNGILYSFTFRFSNLVQTKDIFKTLFYSCFYNLADIFERLHSLILKCRWNYNQLDGTWH